MASQVDGADLMWGDLVGAVGTSKLCGDLVIQILVMLPVKSILRFKSVCKAWYALLNSPAFIRHHHHIVGVGMTNLSSFLIHTQRRRRNDPMFSRLLEDSCGKPVKKIMDFSFKGNFSYIEVVGSINGLVCLSLCINATSIVLWNPATRKHFQIPNPQLLLKSEDYVTVGFAYDQETDSYKVVRILYHSYFRPPISLEPQVVKIEIYSTRTNTWRTTEVVDFPVLLYPDKAGVVVCGVPYWFAPKTPTANFQDLVVWFDASAEAFRFHPLPPNNNSDDDGLLSVTSLGEHLVLMNQKHRRLDAGGGVTCVERVNIRKLVKFDDDGGKVSFHVDKLTVQPPGPNLKYIIGIWRNVELIALDHDNTLHLCGPEEHKHLPEYGSWIVPKFYYYHESLVWPSGLA